MPAGKSTLSIDNIKTRPQHSTLGITLIVSAMFVTSLQDVIYKIFSSELTLWQIFSLRGLLALPLLLALASVRGIRGRDLLEALRKWTLLRSLFMTLCFLAFYSAIPFLSLSTVGAANFIAPIFVTLLSAYVISEPVGLRGWIAVFVGFTGVIILLQPGTDAFSLWAVLPVMGGIFYALSHITTRTKCLSVPLPIMALALNIVMLTTGLIMSVIIFFWQPGETLVQANPYLLGNWSPVNTSEWIILGLLAVFAVVISMGIAGAYQSAAPSLVATFEYSYLVFAAMWDYFFFSSPANGATISGMLLIVGAGLLVLRRR